jgi:purine-binding chemotaxis protein CheW
MKRAKTDWGIVRERMRASEVALARALAPAQERIEEVYRHRAILLATVQEQHRPAAPRLPVLICQVAQERYAIEVRDVAEVLPLARCTPVPGASRNILGVINLRGALRAVVDLGHLLKSSEVEPGDSGFVLMLRNKGHAAGSGEIGLKVDRIEALLEVTPQEWVHAESGTFGKGLVSGNLMLVDVEKVLEGIVSTKEFLTT